MPCFSKNKQTTLPYASAGQLHLISTATVNSGFHQIMSSVENLVWQILSQEKEKKRNLHLRRDTHHQFSSTAGSAVTNPTDKLTSPKCHIQSRIPKVQKTYLIIQFPTSTVSQIISNEYIISLRLSQFKYTLHNLNSQPGHNLLQMNNWQNFNNSVPFPKLQSNPKPQSNCYLGKHLQVPKLQ